MLVYSKTVLTLFSYFLGLGGKLTQQEHLNEINDIMTNENGNWCEYISKKSAVGVPSYPLSCTRLDLVTYLHIYLLT